MPLLLVRVILIKLFLECCILADKRRHRHSAGLCVGRLHPFLVSLVAALAQVVLPLIPQIVRLKTVLERQLLSLPQLLLRASEEVGWRLFSGDHSRRLRRVLEKQVVRLAALGYAVVMLDGALSHGLRVVRSLRNYLPTAYRMVPEQLLHTVCPFVLSGARVLVDFGECLVVLSLNKRKVIICRDEEAMAPRISRYLRHWIPALGFVALGF